MKLLDAMGRELEVGDAVVPQDTKIQDWVIADIKNNELTASANDPPKITITIMCKVHMTAPNIGQPVMALPLFLVRKGIDASKGHQA
jgi:hypothetical protein